MRVGRAIAVLAAVVLAAAGEAGCSLEREAGFDVVFGAAPTTLAHAASPDILVIVADALRADHLGAYGYARATSPFLDAWAQGAARFEHAYTHGTHTRIAMASLFTGTLPTLHRVRRVADWSAAAYARGESDGLAAELETWAESLRAVGYETWAFSANPNVSPTFGFAQGFTRFETTASRDGRVLVERVLAALDGRARSTTTGPLFLYVHLMDPHNPYAPPEPWDALWNVPRARVVHTNGLRPVDPADLAYSIAQYDGEIRYLDTLIERLLGVWESDDDPRPVVFLSDHGEEFQEHGGLGHGKTVYEENARTVLLAKGPGVTAGRSTDSVGHVDVHRLVLDWAQAVPPTFSRGRPIAEWSAAASADGSGKQQQALYTEARDGLVGLRTAELTLVFSRKAPENAVYFDRAEDPHEQRALQDPETLNRLFRTLDALVEDDRAAAERLNTPARVQAAEQTLRQLEALGYVPEESVD